MPIRYDKKSKRWRFEFNRIVGSKRIRHSRLLPPGWSQDQAHAYDRQESGRIYAIASGIEKPSPLIEEALQLYLDYKIPGLRNGKKAAQDLAHLLPYIEGKSLKELGDIARIYARENLHLAPATVRNRLSYLKSAVRYAYKHHNLGDRDYTDKMVFPTVRNKRQVYIEQKTLHQGLLANCEDEEARAVFTLAFYTGLRWRSEILSLTREQIVKVKRQSWLSIPDSKSGEPHMIPVHPDAVEALRFIPFQWSDSYYYARFWKARRASGLEHVKMHDNRHSFASALLSSGATLGEVGRALNHKSAQSTERYSHLYPERVRELVLRIPRTKKSAPSASNTPKSRVKKTA